jgi:hypothetical protein
VRFDWAALLMALFLFGLGVLAGIGIMRNPSEAPPEGPGDTLRVICECPAPESPTLEISCWRDLGEDAITLPSIDPRFYMEDNDADR